MRFKLIVAMAEEKWTDALMDAARDAGAKGSTVIHNGKGKGVDVAKTFLRLSLEIAIDIILLLVEEHQSRTILEALEKAGDMKEKEPESLFRLTWRTLSAYLIRFVSWSRW